MSGRRRDGSGSNGRMTFLCPLEKFVTGMEHVHTLFSTPVHALPLSSYIRSTTKLAGKISYLPRNWTMPVNRFGKSRHESWEHPEATSMQGSSGARNSAGLRRSAAGVTLLWKYRYQRWYLDRRTWIWTSYDLASGLSDVDYQTNLSYPLPHVCCSSQLILMMDNGPSLKWRRRRANVQH